MMRRSSIKINIFLFTVIAALTLFLLVGCGSNGGTGVSPQHSLTTEPSSQASPATEPPATTQSSPATEPSSQASPATEPPATTQSSSPRSPAILCSIHSPEPFVFNLDPGGDPNPEIITFTNCGGSSSWTSSINTDNGVPWLSIQPPGGALSDGASQTVSVKVISKNLAISDYKGHIAITLGSNTTNFNPELEPLSVYGGCLGVCPSPNPSSTFRVTTNQTDQQTLADMSMVTTKYNWSATVSTTNGGPWLSILPETGSFPPTGTLPSIMVNAAGLQPDTYKGNIIFTIGPNVNTYTYPVTLYVIAASSSPTDQPTQTLTPATPGATQTPTS